MVNQPFPAALAPLFTDRAILLAEPHARNLIARVLKTPAKSDNDDGHADGLIDREPPPYASVDGIAVIPLIGILTKYPSAFPEIDAYFGLCPCYSVIEQIKRATADT